MSVQYPDEDLPSNVIDESSTFAAKRYRNKYSWTPTQDEIQKIYELIFR